jgi:hypothetical protein
MPQDLILNGPQPPRLQYRIPTTKETARPEGQWKALSGKAMVCKTSATDTRLRWRAV